MEELLNKHIYDFDRILILTDCKSESVSSYLFNKTFFHLYQIDNTYVSYDLLNNLLSYDDKIKLIYHLPNKNIIISNIIETSNLSYGVSNQKFIERCDLLLVIKNNKLSVEKCRYNLELLDYQNLDLTMYTRSYKINKLKSLIKNKI